MELSKLARQTTGRTTVFLGKTDLSSAFCVLPLKISCFCWLVFKAEDPADGKFKYFMEKCLSFGASISCSHYQRFSNALRHILKVRTQRKSITNYLDDFLFAAITKWLCNQQIHEFLILCEELAVPVAVEKTEWASTMIVFLGIFLNGEQLLLCIPLEKKQKALKLLNDLTGKKKATVKQLQVLTGYLNFLTKLITPGRTFTRRIYTKYANISKNLKPYQHVNLDQEFRFDCKVWRTFLTNFSDAVVYLPMIDLSNTQNSVRLNFYSDASANERLGMGAVFQNKWLFARWETGFIKKNSPSIEYLELLALTAAVLTWGEELRNMRVSIHCDNMLVVEMINSGVSSCKNCMYLLRLLTLNNLVFNRRVFALHVWLEHNGLADALSRLQFDRFWRLAPANMAKYPCKISPLVWPASQIWIQ